MLFYSLFVLSACCYILYILSEPLEEIGGKIGKLLNLPEAVVSSTFQALATSGPEILISVIAATAYITSSWGGLEFGEKACSGLLNTSFSGMDNFVAIGCFGIILMLYMGFIKGSEIIRIDNSAFKSLLFFIMSSVLFCIFIYDGVMSVVESWVLFAIVPIYIIGQFFVKSDQKFKKTKGRFKGLVFNGYLYICIVFAVILFVKESLRATFDIGSLGYVSIGGILLALTSYVSSFPEFMLTLRFAVKNKKNAMLGMLFGSNVIDLGFSGFRPMWTGEAMKVYTTGQMPELLFGYLVCLPVIAILTFIGLKFELIKYNIAYPMSVFYVIYVVSGLILL